MARSQFIPVQCYQFSFNNFHPGLQRHVNQILLSIALTTIKVQGAITIYLNFEHCLRVNDYLGFPEFYGLEDKYLEGRHFERSSSGVN